MRLTSALRTAGGVAESGPGCGLSPGPCVSRLLPHGHAQVGPGFPLESDSSRPIGDKLQTGAWPADPLSPLLSQEQKVGSLRLVWGHRRPEQPLQGVTEVAQTATSGCPTYARCRVWSGGRDSVSGCRGCCASRVCPPLQPSEPFQLTVPQARTSFRGEGKTVRLGRRGRRLQAVGRCGQGRLSHCRQNLCLEERYSAGTAKDGHPFVFEKLKSPSPQLTQFAGRREIGRFQAWVKYLWFFQLTRMLLTSKSQPTDKPSEETNPRPAPHSEEAGTPGFPLGWATASFFPSEALPHLTHPRGVM